MFNSTILDVAIALIFLFLSVSLAAGTITEAIASLFKLRAKTLQTGLMDLLNDPDFNDLAADLYAHALISPRGSGLPVMPTGAQAGAPQPGPVPATPRAMFLRGDDLAKTRLAKNLTTNMPAYIAPKQFAQAFMDVLALLPASGAIPTLADLQAAVDARVPTATNPQMNQLLHGILLRTAGDLNRIRSELADWFDNAMDRVSGAYKRRSQLFTFVAALAVSIVINADALQCAQRVWAQPAIVASLKAGTGTVADAATTWKSAQNLPLGWDGSFFQVRDNAGKPVPLAGGALGLAMMGWLITAFASLFGAPFWFDALQKVTRLKGTGPSPAEKVSGAAAAA